MMNKNKPHKKRCDYSFLLRSIYIIKNIKTFIYIYEMTTEYNHINEQEQEEQQHEEEEHHDKCFFYTFFLGFAGYLVYYIFKDTM